MAVLAREVYDMESRVMAGIVCGLAGGAVMLLFVMLYSEVVFNIGAFTFPNLLATITGGEMSYSWAGGQTLLGLVIHFVFSAFLGGLWGVLMPGFDNRPVLMLAGVFYGFVVYFAMYYIALPIFDLPFALQVRGFMIFLGHLVYGAGFVAYRGLIERFYPRLHP